MYGCRSPSVVSTFFNGLDEIVRGHRKNPPIIPAVGIRRLLILPLPAVKLCRFFVDESPDVCSRVLPS